MPTRYPYYIITSLFEKVPSPMVSLFATSLPSYIEEPGEFIYLLIIIYFIELPLLIFNVLGECLRLRLNILLAG